MHVGQLESQPLQAESGSLAALILGHASVFPLLLFEQDQGKYPSCAYPDVMSSHDSSPLSGCLSGPHKWFDMPWSMSTSNYWSVCFRCRSQAVTGSL